MLSHYYQANFLKTAHDSNMLPALDEQPIYHFLQIKTGIQCRKNITEGPPAAGLFCYEASLATQIFT